jgi:Holliday junction resolvasome RuvABC DNA-binding subunit
MIDQLKGIVEQKTLTYAVLFVNGVGYKLTMSINGLEYFHQKEKKPIY